MRKYQQKQILELIKTLFEVNAEIKRLFSRKDYSSVVGLLAESQEFVVQVGTFIEGISGEGTQTVALLEDFHDELYQASLEVGGENPGNSFVKHLRTRLTDIENSVKTELTPDRIEVVFFPYKPSMWDSLESVWQAAEDDPDCDAYVVPIPYYEKINLTNLGNMIYEGDQYPDYVPITDWRDYDVEKRNPDVIFIHYAYDDKTQNYSVHPNFFAKRMKEFCELLIYIPYYVQSGAEVPEYNGFLPGIVYSDFVIVQSEEVRQGYIEQYSKYYNQFKHVEKLKKPEDKFVALGSPKFDKNLNSEREDYELPEDWKRLINNPDGTSKKVVLYNTHMFRWIDGGEQYFKKVQYVFDTFRTRDDVVLWWRPHPSTEQNFRTLRPQLLEEYYRTVEDYKSAGFGIYDDTADLHRAIACTDAYYGDGSSLVTLCQAAGKLSMIQNISKINNEIGCFPLRLINVNESIYFTTLHVNALFKIDSDDWNPVYIASFPKEKSYLQSAGDIHYYDFEIDGDTLFLSPYGADEIGSYSLSDGSFSKIAFPLKDTIGDDSNKFFWSVKKFRNDLYFSPFKYGAVLRLNIINKEVSVFDDFVVKLRIRFPYLNRLEFCYPAYSEESLWFAVLNTNIVVQFDTNTLKSTIHRIGKESNKFNGICFDGVCLWFSSNESVCPVVRWNTVTGDTKEFTDFFKEEDKPLSYQRIIYCGGSIWLFPVRSQNVYKIDIKTNKIAIEEAFSTRTEFGSSLMKFFAPCVLGENIYLCNRLDETFMRFNVISGILKKEKICFPVDMLDSFKQKVNDLYHSKKIQDKLVPWSEDSISNLGVFCDCVSDTGEAVIGRFVPRRNEEQSDKYRIGYNIHQFWKNIVW